MEHQISNIRKNLPDKTRERLNQISRLAEPALARTTNVLTEFTEHDLNHSFGVEKMYDILFKDDFSSLTVVLNQLLQISLRNRVPFRRTSVYC